MQKKAVLFALAFMAFVAPLVSCGSDDDSPSDDTSSQVVTGNASDISMTSATVEGYINVTDGVEIESYGIQYASSADIDTAGDARTVNASEVVNRKFTVTLPWLSYETTYYYRAFLVLSSGMKYVGQVRRFTTSKLSDRSGNAVDLGLSVRWASFNVGATSPDGYGAYFAWGETSPKTSYEDSNYKWYEWYEDSYFWPTKYSYFIDYDHFADNKLTLEPSDDAATANWGSPWRMPTHDEMLELMTKCSWTWTTHDGVSGCIVTGPNGNAIFLPAAGVYYNDELRRVGGADGNEGHYWTSSLDNSEYGYVSEAYSLIFYQNAHYGVDRQWIGSNVDSGDREWGRPVRPVRP